MNTVCVAGGSGFIGHNLVQRLRTEGFTVILLSRQDFQTRAVPEKIKNCSILINLTGESIAGLWTKGKKKRIYESRVITSRRLVEAVNLAGADIKLMIQVSGVSLYDNQNIHGDDSIRYNNGFLKKVILDWEGELNNLRISDVRVVILRLGIVLDKSGGMLKQILYPFRMGFGVGIRSEDYFPFVHLEDLMNVFMFCIKNQNSKGIFNVVAPVPVTIRSFFVKLARCKSQKIIIWFGNRSIRILMGESGSLLTSGQRVIPAKLQNDGFVFKYDNIEDALNRACN